MHSNKRATCSNNEVTMMISGLKPGPNDIGGFKEKRMRMFGLVT